jgi:hypothetical protein
MSPKYTELFIIHYTGSTDDLRDYIKQIQGIVSFSLSTDHTVVENREIEANITYDSHRTDRTQIANKIEQLENATITFG